MLSLNDGANLKGQIELRELGRDNWFECSQLSVSEEQKALFPIAVPYWMARAKYEDDVKELAIYHDEQIVGFCVYGIDPDDGKPWIIAILIDQKYQGKGYGRKAVQKLIHIIREKSGCHEIYIGHRPQNEIAGKLYESLGFKETGEIVDGEIIRCLKTN